MPFDPDAYARGGTAPAFDPDAYASGGAPPRPGEAGAPVAPTREQEIRAEKLKALMAPGEPGYTARAKDSATLGLSRPLGGAMSVIGGEIGELFGGKPATVGERWRGGVGAEEDYAKRAIENTKGPLGTATDIAGGLVSGGAATGPVSFGRQVLQAGALGGVEGAARNAEDLPSAATGAGIGAGLGAGSSAVVGALIDRLGRVVGAKRAIGEASRGGSSETLRNEGSAIYRRLDDAGIHYGGSQTAPFVGRVAQRLADEGFNANMHRQLIPVLDEIGSSSGQRATWTQLQNMRTQISDLKASQDPRMRRVAGAVGEELDDFIRTAKPTVPARSVGVNPAQEVEVARDLWRRQSLAGNAEALAEKGMRRAPDPAAKLAANFEKYSDRFLDPKRYNPNGPEEMRLMDRIVEGSPGREALAKTLNRWGGNLLGYGSAAAVGGQALPFLLPDSSTAGTAASGAGLAALALGAGMKGGGTMLRRAAAEQGQARADDLIRHIVTGTTAVPPGLNPAREALSGLIQHNVAGPLPPGAAPRDALSLLLAAQDARRAVGTYAGSYVNRE